MKALFFVLICSMILGICAVAQTPVQQSPSAENPYSRKNTFSIFGEYSNTSSPILLGQSRQRKLADFGGAYARRIVRFRSSDLNYLVEVRPVLFESDPLTIDHYTFSFAEPTGPPYTGSGVAFSVNYGACHPFTYTFVIPPSGTYLGETQIHHYTCGRQWTFGQEFTPFGLKYSMRTRHPLQPFAVATAGYMYTSRPVPLADAEAFNFVFNFGAGVELFKSEKRGRSVSAEVRVQHFSNKNTAESNPGTDNVMYKVSYNFGK